MAESKKTPETVDVAEQIKAMLEEAKAEAKRIVDEAKASVKGGRTPEEEAKRKEAIAKGEELVEVQLFKDGGKYQDDVFVSVNGENVVIKRGEKVKIKRKFAEVLENSMRQDVLVADMIAKAKEQSKKSTADL